MADFDKIFLSTLSLRRATARPPATAPTAVYFYPRSPCGERHSASPWQAGYMDFYPRSPCGERPAVIKNRTAFSVFLSTLSLRRATPPSAMLSSGRAYFYPRSPCGERRNVVNAPICILGISIHALLAESDASILCTSVKYE